MVKEALEEAEKAQDAAEKAIKLADEDIQGTQDLLTSVSFSHLNLLLEAELWPCMFSCCFTFVQDTQ